MGGQGSYGTNAGTLGIQLQSSGLKKLWLKSFFTFIHTEFALAHLYPEIRTFKTGDARGALVSCRIINVNPNG